MGNKDTINRICGITSLFLLFAIIGGYISGIDELFGFPNAMMFYFLMPAVLIWFGTRKNGCGSCNQTCSISKDEEQIEKNS